MNKNILSLSVREPKNTLKFTKMSTLNHEGNSKTLLKTHIPVLTTYVFMPNYIFVPKGLGVAGRQQVSNEHCCNVKYEG